MAWGRPEAVDTAFPLKSHRPRQDPPRASRKPLAAVRASRVFGGGSGRRAILGLSWRRGLLRAGDRVGCGMDSGDTTTG